MSKAVLISIQPKWCNLIASGEKTVEVRKSRPKLETPFKCYIYRTKGNVKHLINDKWVNMAVGGTVIGEFVCDKITYFGNVSTDPWERLLGETHEENKRMITNEACLSENEIRMYGGKYGWHISDLVIYDKPRELTEFYKNGTLSNEAFCETTYDGRRSYADYLFTRAVRRPPQSWCYVEEEIT